MRIISHALCFVAGIIATVIVTAKPGEPPAKYQKFYLSGQLEEECPLDAKGQMHGELRTYYPSGRLRAVADVVHGQMGAGQSYFDPVLDGPTPVVSGDDRAKSD